MKYFLILALCIAAVQAFYVRNDKPVKLMPVPADGRVVHGQPAYNGQFPHMVFTSVGCGGSILSSMWISTAAHCVDKATSVTLYMGHVNYQQSPVVVVATKIHIYPGWNPNAIQNDFALIQLDSPISFTDNIKPIRLPSSSQDQYVGEVAAISGFGYINDQFVFPNVLQWANLQVISNDECREHFFGGIVDSSLCTFGTQVAAQGTCRGDSGSGLLLRRPDGDILIGVSSFVSGEGCETPSPSGFARVTFFLDWIRQTTGLSS